MQITTKQASKKSFLKLTAADLMSVPIVTIPYDMLLRDAGNLLVQQAISGAPVIDAEGNCVGVLSAADFITPPEARSGTTNKQADISFVAPWGEIINLECSSGCVVRDYMTEGPVAVSPHTPIGQIAQIMVDAHIHRVLVAENNRPCGIVSSTDLVAAIAGAAQKHLGEQPNTRLHNTFSQEDLMSCVRFLDQHGIQYRLYRHDQTFDAQHMAQSLHVPGKSVAKTVMARTRVGSRYFVLVVPAPHRIDWNRVSGALGGVDVELATESQMLEHCPDCAFGVVPLFGSQYGLETIVDETVANQDEIVVQGDTHEEAVRLRFSDFYAVEHPKVAAIAQPHHESEFVEHEAG